MTFSKTAYLSLTLPADPTAPGPEFDIRGIYKTRKVRTFDTNGNQTGYLFSANPAWQLLDAFISLHLKPHGLANEPLITAEKDRIDFVAFKSAADFCDVDIGGGVKRFESHVVFLSETNLATIFDTLTALCRGYLLEQNGKLGLFIDQPRNSVYTFTRANVLASGFQAPAKPFGRLPIGWSSRHEISTRAREPSRRTSLPGPKRSTMSRTRIAWGESSKRISAWVRIPGSVPNAWAATG